MKLLKYTTKVGTGTCNLLKVLADPKFGMLLTALNPNKGADDEIEVTPYPSAVLTALAGVCLHQSLKLCRGQRTDFAHDLLKLLLIHTVTALLISPF